MRCIMKWLLALLAAAVMVLGGQIAAASIGYGDEYEDWLNPYTSDTYTRLLVHFDGTAETIDSGAIAPQLTGVDGETATVETTYPDDLYIEERGGGFGQNLSQNTLESQISYGNSFRDYNRTEGSVEFWFKMRSWGYPEQGLELGPSSSSNRIA